MIKLGDSYNLDQRQRMLLISRLNALCKFLDRSYNINSGGCCYTCYLISKKLEEMNIKYKVVIADCEFDDECLEEVQEIQNAIKSRDLDSICCGDYVSSHYMIKIDDKIINPDDVTDDPTIEIELNSDDLKWIYNTGDWNDSYNIRLNGILKSYINTLFNAFKIELL